MDLGTGGKFTSDIDILARLLDYPRSHNWLYKSWEVKVGLLCRDGTGRSLKAGKTARTMTQLKAYREFGSPAVSLLDVYVCEDGFMGTNRFPPPSLYEGIGKKIAELKPAGFGYQLLPFEHGSDGTGDVGLRAIATDGIGLSTMFELAPAVDAGPREPFSRLADHINEFFEKSPDRPRKSFHQIVFCRSCRQLQMICMKNEYTCPTCKDDLIAQS